MGWPFKFVNIISPNVLLGGLLSLIILRSPIETISLFANLLSKFLIMNKTAKVNVKLSCASVLCTKTGRCVQRFKTLLPRSSSNTTCNSVKKKKYIYILYLFDFPACLNILVKNSLISFGCDNTLLLICTTSINHISSAGQSSPCTQT